MDREKQITINIRPTDATSFTIRIKKGEAMKYVKVLTMSHMHPNIESEKKLLNLAKNFTWHFGEKVIEPSRSHHKTTVRAFQLTDGATINLVAHGSGGGKRVSSSC
jgi:hypothetical protein